MVKIILAANTRDAVNFCRENNLIANQVVIVRDVRSIEGLRFRYEDVIRVKGWSNHYEIEDIEDRILKIHIMMS